MTRQIDHIVIAVRDLAQASADYERLGFTVTPGGEHASGETHNALVGFSDGAYFELIAFKQPAQPSEHRWWTLLNEGEGLVDFALGADNLEAEAARLAKTSLPVAAPHKMGRNRPDGQRVDWQVLRFDAETTKLPFLIEDFTPRDLRVPSGEAAKHANGVTGVAGITILVADLDRSAAAYAALLETDGTASASTIAGIHSAQRFRLGEQWIELAQPAATAVDLQQRLQARGDGPYEVVLRTAGTRPESDLLPLAEAHGARIRLER